MAPDVIPFCAKEEYPKEAIRSKYEATSTILVWLLHHVAIIPYTVYQQSVRSLLKKIHSIQCSIPNGLVVFVILNLEPNSQPLKINAHVT